MSVFSANVVVKLYRMTGFDLYGQSTYSAAVSVAVNVIKFDDLIAPTPIRDAASASHGRAEEQIAKAATLLFPPNFKISFEDRVDVYGAAMQVIGVWPRYDLFGAMDHVQVSLRRFQIETPQYTGT